MKDGVIYTDVLRVRLAAFVRDCVRNGDMTPAAARMLSRILDEIETTAT